MQQVLSKAAPKNFRIPTISRGVWILIAAVFTEIAIFSFAGQNFLTAANFFEILRFSVELGLLATALTPVIITGGIDLSVGSAIALTGVITALGINAGWSAILAIALGILDGGAVVSGCGLQATGFRLQRRTG